VTLAVVVSLHPETDLAEWILEIWHRGLGIEIVACIGVSSVLPSASHLLAN
jgi:hypothetical protein